MNKTFFKSLEKIGENRDLSLKGSDSFIRDHFRNIDSL